LRFNRAFAKSKQAHYGWCHSKGLDRSLKLAGVFFNSPSEVLIRKNRLLSENRYSSWNVYARRCHHANPLKALSNPLSSYTCNPTNLLKGGTTVQHRRHF
jgi:hypothetical protein